MKVDPFFYAHFFVEAHSSASNIPRRRTAVRLYDYMLL